MGEQLRESVIEDCVKSSFSDMEDDKMEKIGSGKNSGRRRSTGKVTSRSNSNTNSRSNSRTSSKDSEITSRDFA